MFKMRRFSKLLSLICVMALLMASISGCGGSQQDTDSDAGDSSGKEVIEMVVGAGHPADTVQWTYGVTHFFQKNVQERVAAETDYEIQWTEAYGGTVAKLGEVLEAVEGGLLDVGMIVYVFEPTKLMLEGMTYRMPFQSPDPIVVAEAAMELYEEYPEFKADFEKYNQKFLGLAVSDNYNLFTTFPVDEVSDLENKKIAGAGANLKWIEGTGTVGVQSNLNEGYTSMQTGVYEGFINPTGAMYRFKIHEVSDYLLLADFGVQIVGGLTINMDTWNSLPEEVQQIMLEEGENMTMLEAQYTKDLYESDLAAMESEGVTITQLSQEAKEEWVAKIPNVPGELAAELNSLDYPGTEIVKAYFAKLVERGFIMPRDWEL